MGGNPRTLFAKSSRGAERAILSRAPSCRPPARGCRPRPAPSAARILLRDCTQKSRGWPLPGAMRLARQVLACCRHLTGCCNANEDFDNNPVVKNAVVNTMLLPGMCGSYWTETLNDLCRGPGDCLREHWLLAASGLGWNAFFESADWPGG